MTAKCNRHKVKYGLDYFFVPFFGSFYKGGWGESTPLVLREGGKQSLSTEGGVGGESVITQGGVRDGLLLRREGGRLL